MTTTLPKPRRTRAAVTEPSVQPDTTGQLSDNDMYERMVSAILDHRLPPGTKLVEDKLAAAFGVSRTRVRPVLVRLANEQVVTLTPNRGASIAQPTPQEALEVFEARRLLEPRLVELFIANATGTPLAMTDLLTILLVSLITSKGAHGIPGSALVILAATLTAIPAIPVVGLVLVLAVDWFMGIARALGNLVGNCVATVAIAAWEGDIDRERAHAVLDGKAEPLTEEEDHASAIVPPVVVPIPHSSH